MRRPKKGEYYYYDNCGGKKVNKSCFGDCLDCYLHDMYHFEKYLKKNSLPGHFDHDKTSTPEVPYQWMGRGCVRGG